MRDARLYIYSSTISKEPLSEPLPEPLPGPFANHPSQVRLIQDLLRRGGALIVAERVIKNRRLWVRAVAGPRPLSIPAPALKANEANEANESKTLMGQDWYCGLLDYTDEPTAGSSDESRTLLDDPDEGVWADLWAALFQEALKIAGRTLAVSMTAPLNESSWFGYRLRLDDDPQGYPWEPRRCPGLRSAINGLGFTPRESYRSVGSTGLGQLAARVETSYKLSLEQGFTYCTLAAFVTETQRAEVLEAVWSLCNRGFATAPYFAPISFDDFVTYYVGGLSHPQQRSLNIICKTSDHAIAGFLFGYLNAQELVFKSMAIDRPYQGQRLGDAILYPMAKQGLDLGIDAFVSALVLQGNRSEFVFRKNTTRWEHHYGVFRYEF